MRMNSKTIKQIVLFGIVGVLSLLIDVTVTTLLYKVFSVPASIASVIGFFSAFAFNFPVNRKKVFHHSFNDKFTLVQQILLYFALLLFNALFTAFATDVLVKRGIDISFAKITLTAMIAIWNYLIFRYFIFNKVRSYGDIVKD